MLIEMSLNENKVKEYNKKIEKLKKEYEDFIFEKVKNINDRFIPYQELLNDNGWDNCKTICKDIRTDFNGVYICELNEEHTLSLITDYEWFNDLKSPIYWHDYGIADNASQVLDYYDELCNNYSEYMNFNDFIILMNPVFKGNEFRWYKWGKYIGIHNIEYEDFNDEENIDYIYVFKIVCIKKENK